MCSEARTVTSNNAFELSLWCGGKMVVEHDALDHEISSPGINVPVGDTVERASVGNIIIRNSDGSFRVAK